MTLQQLIGELQTLAQAYPETTPVEVKTVDFRLNILSINAESRLTGVEVVIEVG